jgi:hypothetical protein
MLLKARLRGSFSLLRERSNTFGRHGDDFGLVGPWNKAQAAEMRVALNMHINNPDVLAITG